MKIFGKAYFIPSDRASMAGLRVYGTHQLEWSEHPIPVRRCQDEGICSMAYSPRLQQHAGDVVVLWRVSDEEIEFGHQTLEHLCGRARTSGINRSQHADLAIFGLTGVLG